MQEKLLKELVSGIAGVGSERIVDILYKKDNVNEFLIAKKLAMTINQVRNILYKLADEGLVVFSRKKDEKSGGWYTYFWTLNVGKSLVNLRERIAKDLEHLNHQLTSKQNKQFYVCKNCDMEMSEENALLNNFTCPECGEVFEINDNSANIVNLKTGVAELNAQLDIVDEEVTKIRHKEGLARARRMKLEAEKKKEARRIKREATRKTKKKLVKKTAKKKKKVKPARKKKIKNKYVKKKIKRKPVRKKTIKRKLLKKKVKRKPVMKKIISKRFVNKKVKKKIVGKIGKKPRKNTGKKKVKKTGVARSIMRRISRR